MTGFAQCLGTVAPFYNLVLVLVVLILFAKLITIKNKNIFLKPWKLLYFAVLVYVLEEFLTVLNIANMFYTPRIINAFFEFIMIITFIYLLLLQKEYLHDKETKKNIIKKKK